MARAPAMTPGRSTWQCLSLVAWEPARRRAQEVPKLARALVARRAEDMEAVMEATAAVTVMDTATDTDDD